MRRRRRQLFLTFQSTLSVRRATDGGLGLGETIIISIHALRKESDVGLPS